LETARQLLADASTHVLLGSRSIEKGQKAIELLQSEHISGTVELVQVDVSDEGSVSAAAKAVENKHGRCVATTSLLLSSYLLIIYR
jgi:NAD(P)-dependent dehydrogenase (short-subunit alcohol dehydrogenase family)